MRFASPVLSWPAAFPADRTRTLSAMVIIAAVALSVLDPIYAEPRRSGSTGQSKSSVATIVRARTCRVALMQACPLNGANRLKCNDCERWLDRGDPTVGHLLIRLCPTKPSGSALSLHRTHRDGWAIPESEG